MLIITNDNGETQTVRKNYGNLEELNCSLSKLH